jgi:hypothetical protein
MMLGAAPNNLLALLWRERIRGEGGVRRFRVGKLFRIEAFQAFFSNLLD